MKYRPGWTHPHRPSTASGLCSGGRSSALRSAQLTFDPPAVAPLIPRTFRFSRSLPQSTGPHARTQILFGAGLCLSPAAFFPPPAYSPVRASEWSSTSRSARAIHLQPRPSAPSNTRKISQKFGDGKRICRNQECLIYTINIKLPFRVINAHVMDLWCQMGKTTSIELVYGEST
ncbi:hypothetical protein SETIT_1G277400v2 [Setaria italica]|uniref:Uncharacterized protein n=1 Tax=Setaria italica TaxID=4555 RepID=A0A368PQE0_SETIT|nr:hypothetical protein SETIT_1G277400v2 [Setaria italica]